MCAALRFWVIFTALGGAAALAATTPALTQPVPNQSIAVAGGGATIDLRQHFGLPGVVGPLVQFETSMGKIDVELHAEAAPLTVANFLNYVNRGEYDYTFIHRSETNFVIQGGGYFYYQNWPYSITTDAPIPLEYNLPNARGTIAMARGPGLNSATSQWFFNTVDNTTTLGPANNGGYAVFGRVIGTGMSVVDAIAALGVYNIIPEEYGFDHPFLRVPVQVVNGGGYLVELVIDTIAAYPSANSGTASVLKFTVQSSDPTVATAALSGSDLQLAAGGAPGTATVTVTATDTHGNTASGSFTVSVNKLAQTITFAELADRPFDLAPIVLSGSADSALPVNFDVVAGPAEISGSTLTVLAPGTVTVRATQAGNEVYAAAPAVERTFTVAPNFLSWRVQHFTAAEREDVAISGPSAVLAGDGLSNLLKYALGLAPRTPVASGLPQAGLAADGWTFTYGRPAERPDLTYAVEVSTNLSSWSSAGVAHERIATVDGSEQWRGRVPFAAGTVVFFRLRVTQP